MRYQLVLQFPGESVVDYDSLVYLENGLVTILGGSAEVDGHDFGAGEGNIFILTDDPISTFESVKGWLATEKVLNVLIAAHRQLEEEDYVVIWPEQFSGTFTVE